MASNVPNGSDNVLPFNLEGEPPLYPGFPADFVGYGHYSPTPGVPLSGPVPPGPVLPNSALPYAFPSSLPLPGEFPSTLPPPGGFPYSPPLPDAFAPTPSMTCLYNLPPYGIDPCTIDGCLRKRIIVHLWNGSMITGFLRKVYPDGVLLLTEAVQRDFNGPNFAVGTLKVNQFCIVCLYRNCAASYLFPHNPYTEATI